jgi:NDP-sugar pyrophosphorylase family protein
MTTAILLAAGHGTRLGRDKPTVVLGGETLLQRHMRQARTAGVTSFIIVTNEDNRAAVADHAAQIADGTPFRVVLQEGPDAHAAAATGLRLLPGDCTSAFVCGITDIVPDISYALVAKALPEYGIGIASAILERTFVGGMLSFRPGTHQLERIIERPPGGCPPGRLVNIWIHHLAGHELITRISRDTAALGDYETAVNHVLADGTPGAAVVLPFWEAIKDPDSLTRARALIGDTPNHNPTAA